MEWNKAPNTVVKPGSVETFKLQSGEVFFQNFDRFVRLCDFQGDLRSGSPACKANTGILGPLRLEGHPGDAGRPAFRTPRDREGAKVRRQRTSLDSSAASRCLLTLASRMFPVMKYEASPASPYSGPFDLVYSFGPSTSHFRRLPGHGVCVRRTRLNFVVVPMEITSASGALLSFR